jgi:hypothetical protein
MSLAGLGRLYIPDGLDGRFPASAVLPPKAERSFRYWNSNRWWGDQGGTSQCVAYSWAHWAERPANRTTPWRSAGGHLPTGRPSDRRWAFHGQRPVFDLDHGYNWMQRNDYWEGEDYDGTSVRAGAQYLRNQGLLDRFYWAHSVNEISRALLEVGPVVVGTDWMMDMFIVNNAGWITATGESAGGHAYLLDGVNTRHKFFRIKNTWGRTWGKQGFARISFDDMDKLLSNYGEACIAIQ